jgi:DNA-binding IclR family transcriptional regulator
MPDPSHRRGTTLGSGSSALARSIAIITSCGRPGGAAFGELKAALEVVPATLVRLLAQLQREGLVAKTADRRYALGPAAMALAEAIAGGPSRPRLVQPAVEALAEDTGESAAFFEGSAGGMTLIAKREMPDSFHYLPLFGRRRLLEMAFGYAILAARPPAACAAAITSHCAGGRERPERLAIALSRVRRLGHVAHQERHSGTFRLAAPVRERGGVIGVVGISCAQPAGPRLARLTERVLAAAAQIEALLIPNQGAA